MRGKIGIRRAVLPLAALTGLAVVLALAAPRLGTAQQDQQGQQSQGQSQKEKQPEKKGGFFGGLKAVTTQSSDQNKATASAGSKGALDGKQIADMTPTPADRQKVTDMENYSIPQGDLKKFQDDGHLQPNK